MLNLQVGQKLSGFEVKGILGSGGMGAVYLVWDPGLQQSRALKVIKIAPEKVRSKTAEHLKARFLVEARTLASLDHPNIIRVFQVGEIAEMPYLVMEYFPGQDLSHWLNANGGRLPVKAVVHVLRQLASALEYAHELEHPVVHRDIKLANALLGTDGSAKLIDFGLAKSNRTASLTQTGVSVGTTPYWAPEYVSESLYGDGRAEHTPLTDLWALGVIAYVLLTNSYPIYDSDHLRLCKKITTGEYAPLRRRRREVSAELEATIHKLLAADPDERFQSARAFIAALSSLSELVDESVEPTPMHYDDDSIADVGSSMLIAAESISRTDTGGAETEIGLNREVGPVSAGSITPPFRRPLLADLELGEVDAGENPFASDSNSIESLGPMDPTVGVGAPPREPQEAEFGAFASQVSAVFDNEGGVIAAFSERGVAPVELSLSSFYDASSAKAQRPVASGLDLLSSSSDPLAAINSAVAMLPSAGKGAPLSHVGGGPSGSDADAPSPRELSDSHIAELSAPKPSAFTAAVDGAINFAGAPSMPNGSSEQQARGGNAVISELPGGLFNDLPTPSDVSLAAPAFAPKPIDGGALTKKWRALVLPFAAALGVAVFGLLAVTASKSARPDQAASYVDPDSVAKERTGKEELARLEHVPEAIVPRVVPSALEQSEPVNAQATPLPIASETTKRPKVSTRRRSNQKPAKTPAPADDPWAKRFGTRDLNAASQGKTAKAASAASTAHSGDASAASGAGTRIPARLKQELASAPLGPVIAAVTKTTNVGGRSIKAGSELHGSVSSVSGSRILVTFSRVRLRDGTSFKLRGRALARDGRAGLKGRRTLGGASDVAAAAVEAGANSALDELGNVIGKNPAGAAINSGGRTASGKSRNLNAAESIIVVKKASRFVVYVDGLE